MKFKGMSAVSEALMALGVVVISIMFVLVAGNIINFQTGQTTLTTQQSIPETISNIIEVMKSMDGEVYYTYEPDKEVYTLKMVDQAFLEVSIPQENINSSAFVSEDISIENQVIENQEKLCIQKQGEKYQILGGECQ